MDEDEATDEVLLDYLEGYLRRKRRLLTLDGPTQAPAAAPQSRIGQQTGPVVVHRLALLTSREGEVARLIASAISNREIAAALGITEGTAESHVQHIFNKLGFHSRVQIAGWVIKGKMDGAR